MFYPQDTNLTAIDKPLAITLVQHDVPYISSADTQCTKLQNKTGPRNNRKALKVTYQEWVENWREKIQRNSHLTPKTTFKYWQGAQFFSVWKNKPSVMWRHLNNFHIHFHQITKIMMLFSTASSSCIVHFYSVLMWDTSVDKHLLFIDSLHLQANKSTETHSILLVQGVCVSTEVWLFGGLGLMIINFTECMSDAPQFCVYAWNFYFVYW